MIYLKHSHFNNNSQILGIREGFLFNHLFDSQKSKIKWTALFFFRNYQSWSCNKDYFLYLNTPMSVDQLTSDF